MEGLPISVPREDTRNPRNRRWLKHSAQGVLGPHQDSAPAWTGRFEEASVGERMIRLDGSQGEGGGQILRSALTLSLLTGQAFRMEKIRANRDKPGLRPQHLTAVDAAASLCGAVVSGLSVGSREIVFRPEPYEPEDVTIDIGTAGSTALVLHTLLLPIALRATKPIRVVLVGGTFNDRAPSFPFLENTWRTHLKTLGLPVVLAMPQAGFYPQGGGRLEAWIEPSRPRALNLPDRGALKSIWGEAGVLNLPKGIIAERMRDQALERLSERGLQAEITLKEWKGRGRGAAFSLTAETEHAPPATFVGLGARGKPSEQVANDAVDELLAYLDHPGAVDPHSADQLLLPLALADGPGSYSVTEITEHLRTNARTIRAFLDRDIRIEEPEPGQPGRVEIR